MTSQRVTLFVPCLVDQLYPEMGIATVRVLEHVGYTVSYNPEQTCCGQPAFNAGHRRDARKVAGRLLDALRGEETIVCPSGSCTGMVRNYYGPLFEGDPRQGEALELGRRVLELSELLVKDGKQEAISGEFHGRVGFHNSCHSQREIGVLEQPQRLLERISGYELVDAGEQVCCGFGGLFCAKYPDLASAMSHGRLESFLEKGAEVIVSNDPGCIYRMRQEAEYRNCGVRICHLAEFLAEGLGLSNVPAAAAGSF